MRKIPTLFKRDPEDMKRVLPEVHPDCQWVLDGEGVPTRKYDGTCVMFDGEWWARREVKAGKTPPPGFKPVEYDEATGKTVGWEPAEQSSFWKYLYEAIGRLSTGEPFGTYELVGPKINGNPGNFPFHTLKKHAHAERLYWMGEDVPRDFEQLRKVFTSDFMNGMEGIVWHHEDGLMAKLKVRDFPKVEVPTP